MQPLREKKRPGLYILITAMAVVIAVLASGQRDINKERDKVLRALEVSVAELVREKQAAKDEAASALGCPAIFQGLPFSHSVSQAPYRALDSAMLTCFYKGRPKS